MATAFLVAVVVWGGCTLLVICAAVLGRTLPAVSRLLFDSPELGHRPRGAKDG